MANFREIRQTQMNVGGQQMKLCIYIHKMMHSSYMICISKSVVLNLFFTLETLLGRCQVLVFTVVFFSLTIGKKTTLLLQRTREDSKLNVF